LATSESRRNAGKITVSVGNELLMSGPVISADVDTAAVRARPQSGVSEILDSRTANVGSIPVRRALPQRARRTVGAWCFFDHGGPLKAPAGVGGIGPHPHIGLQTVTWMLAGELLHRDSLGTEQTIRPGQLNLMTAAAGIVHAEEHTSDGRVELAQLWIAQPSATRDGPGEFEHYADLPEVDLGGGTATVLVGSLANATSPARRDTDHVGVELLVRSQLVVPADRAYEYVVVPMDAPVEVDGRLVGPGRLAYLGPGREELPVKAAEPARVILLGGVPFEEPILMWWNYVARTREEITAAHADWTQRRARFKIPDSQLAPIDVPPPLWAPPH
jgi:redox-sensitive bicupin YhaK (pirin superfamily)